MKGNLVHLEHYFFSFLNNLFERKEEIVVTLLYEMGRVLEMYSTVMLYSVMVLSSVPSAHQFPGF